MSLKFARFADLRTFGVVSDEVFHSWSRVRFVEDKGHFQLLVGRKTVRFHFRDDETRAEFFEALEKGLEDKISKVDTNSRVGR